MVLYPEKLENIFTKCFWSQNQNNLLKALSVFFGNEISHPNDIFKIKPVVLDLDENLTEINENGDCIIYQKLSAFPEDRPFSLESMDENVNRDETDKTDKNLEINERNILCQPWAFKSLIVLCCCFWGKEIAGKDESDWVDQKYLWTRYSPFSHCLKDAFDYYGIELIVKTKYDEYIMELQKDGKYYAAWIICGDGGMKLPGEGNPNLVG